MAKLYLDVEFGLSCHKCGRKLEIYGETKAEDVSTFSVIPCSSCLQATHDRAWKEFLKQVPQPDFGGFREPVCVDAVAQAARCSNPHIIPTTAQILREYAY